MIKHFTRGRSAAVGGLLALALGRVCAAQTVAAPTAPPTGFDLSLHAQATFVDQIALGFPAPYAGPNSLTPSRGRETADVTIYIGFRPWRGAELWLDPEVDQGFGLDDTLGAAGFPSGEAYKVGESTPYLRLPRLFLRQTIDLGGARGPVDADANQLAEAPTANRLVLTIGKFSVPDIFDTNRYAHDPRGDFLNWSLIDTGSFDYAADAWGYTYGAVAEWWQDRWTLRLGAFDLSTVPNSEALDPSLGQDQYIAEIEERHTIAGRAGRVVITGFLTRGRMGSFADAIRLSLIDGQTPNTGSVRTYSSRTGVSVELEQALTDDLGFFLRAGAADGHREPYEFTDIDQTIGAGLSLTGKRWSRPDDVVGLAGVINDISGIHRQYLADGGLGILVGDGKLPHAGPEEIVEAYYQFALNRRLALSLDGQLITNPGYNRDRGPAPVVAARLHAHF